jgi:hypothetical protein
LIWHHLEGDFVMAKKKKTAAKSKATPTGKTSPKSKQIEPRAPLTKRDRGDAGKASSPGSPDDNEEYP